MSTFFFSLKRELLEFLQDGACLGLGVRCRFLREVKAAVNPILEAPPFISIHDTQLKVAAVN